MKTLVPQTWTAPLERLREDVSETVDRWLRRVRRAHDPVSWSHSVFANGGPLVDVEEGDDEVVIRAELPGLERSDFHVELSGQALVLRGEKRADRQHKGRGYRFAECLYGAFHRMIPLPCEVEEDKIAATYKQGVLTVRLPKAASVKARRVPVEVK